MKNREELIELGFIYNPSSIITHNLNYFIEKKFGKIRTITLSDIGTPNEMIFFREGDARLNNQDDDLIVLHNFDYDGPITHTRIKSLMYGLTGEEKFK